MCCIVVRGRYKFNAFNAGAGVKIERSETGTPQKYFLLTYHLIKHRKQYLILCTKHKMVGRL